MWTYEQGSGKLFHNDVFVAMGYSGAPGECKNNPDKQDEHNLGPIPRGRYQICDLHDTDTHGPYVLRLNPAPDNEMCGRAGFLMHGDSVKNPGTASQGCIIQARAVREQVWNSGDRDLVVTE